MGSRRIISLSRGGMAQHDQPGSGHEVPGPVSVVTYRRVSGEAAEALVIRTLQNDDHVHGPLRAGPSDGKIAADLVVGLQTAKTRIGDVLGGRDRTHAMITAGGSGFVRPS